MKETNNKRQKRIKAEEKEGHKRDKKKKGKKEI